MDEGLMDPSGRQLTKWSQWIGIANVVQTALMIVLVPLTCFYAMRLLESAVQS